MSFEHVTIEGIKIRVVLQLVSLHWGYVNDFGFSPSIKYFPNHLRPATEDILMSSIVNVRPFHARHRNVRFVLLAQGIGYAVVVHQQAAFLVPFHLAGAHVQALGVRALPHALHDVFMPRPALAVRVVVAGVLRFRLGGH